MRNVNTYSILIAAFIVFALCIDCHKDHDEIPGESLEITYEINHISVYGENDGAIDITVSGGTPPYSFLWSDGSVTEDISDLTAGMYSVTVTDALGVTACDSIILDQPDPDSFIIDFEITYPTEPGNTDGSIDITVIGGHAPYTFVWSTGSTNEDISNIGADQYTVTVTDQENQVKTLTVELTDPIVEDIDGNVYRFKKIGDQIWMQENLKVTHTPDQTDITSYCYNNDLDNAEIYGRLYTWDVAMNGSTVEMAQGICPSGWHIPSDQEWKILEMHLGMTPEEANMENIWRGSEVGTKLKKDGESGYEALLSGRRSSSGTYSLLDQFEYVWTSSEYASYAWRRCLDINSDLVGRWNTFPKTYAFSVRCVKDD